MKRLITYEYTYSEYVDYVERTPRKEGNGDASELGDYEYTKTRSFSEALKLAKYGWESGVKALEDFLEVEVAGASHLSYSVAGGIVDVGAFLSGSPECMLQFSDLVEMEKKPLTVYIQLDYTARVEGDEVLSFTKTALKELVKLNQQYTLKIIGVMAGKFDGGQKEFISIIIKDFTQNFVLNNIAFPFHPSFVRRLDFRRLETKDYWSMGYGEPYSKEGMLALVEEYHSKAGKGGYLFIPSVQDIGASWQIKDLKLVFKV